MDEDNSRELMAIKKLKGAEDWNIWKFQISVILKAQGAWNIVTGTRTLLEPLPTASSEIERKEREKEIADWYRMDAITI
ncbi:hypothetical protein KPH14_012192 [Odynerus spinipes]|uniref:Uncharacterized protein n=1 Tax=Odynerus spinipes TaxID=1348599 RepID=A0AAD9VM72_9HYME|nr:hypothetical protein KPH14_012192 [Odynerus spinipes]